MFKPLLKVDSWKLGFFEEASGAVDVYPQREVWKTLWVLVCIGGVMIFKL
jgi:hypothetical protein